MTHRTLVAGIGNIFLGDDGFGVEVVKHLARGTLPDGVEVRDFGIRGMDLVYALLDDYDAVIMVDIAMRDGEPGMLSLLEVAPDERGEVTLDTHGMDPVKVLNLARELGARSRPTYVVACEPAVVLNGEENPDVLVELSPPVRTAIPAAIDMIHALVQRITPVPAESR